MSGQPTTYTNWAAPSQMILSNPGAVAVCPCLFFGALPVPGDLGQLARLLAGCGLSQRTKPSGVVETTVVEPVARFKLSPSSPTVNQPVSFADTSAGAPSSWLWNFGDQGTATDQSPGHTYSTAGSFTVRLTVSNVYGTDSTTRVVTVAQNQPVAGFTFTPSSPSVDQPVSFVDTSTGAPSSLAVGLRQSEQLHAERPRDTCRGRRDLPGDANGLECLRNGRHNQNGDGDRGSGRLHRQPQTCA